MNEFMIHFFLIYQLSVIFRPATTKTEFFELVNNIMYLWIKTQPKD